MVSLEYFEYQEYFEEKLRDLDQDSESYPDLLLFLQKNYTKHSSRKLFEGVINPKIESFLCPNCGAPRLYNNNQKKLRLYCSKECSTSSIVKEITSFLRKEKTRKTCLAKYGVANVSQSEKIKAKKSEKIKAKTQEEKREIELKRKRNNQEKYGVDNVAQLKEVREKAKETCLIKYGVEYATQSEIVQSKRKETTLAKYGVTHFKMKHEIIPEKSSAGEDTLVKFIQELLPEATIIRNSREVISPLELDIYLPDYNLAIEYNGGYWHSVSLDTYLGTTPEDIKKNRLNKRIQEKVNKAEALGINLLNIYDFEFNNPVKREIIYSTLSYKLGKVRNRYYARKLSIKEVSVSEAKEFFNENHIQGYSSAGIKLGLYIENNSGSELISGMTFGKPRYSKEADYELIRFASKKISSCVGCAQKLFKYFLNEVNSDKEVTILSYANRNIAYSGKNIYDILGFERVKMSQADIKFLLPIQAKLGGFKVIPRRFFIKKNLKKYSFFNANKTIFENLKNSSEFSKIRILYGPGTITYKFKLNKKEKNDFKS